MSMFGISNAVARMRIAPGEPATAKQHDALTSDDITGKVGYTNRRIAETTEQLAKVDAQMYDLIQERQRLRREISEYQHTADALAIAANALGINTFELDL